MNTPSLPSEPVHVFDRPLYLAGTLDNAADNLACTWLGYEWNDRTRCNCGIVAREVLQVTPVQLKKLLPPIFEDGNFLPTWREMTEIYCRDTGLTRHEVFSRLLAAGLRPEDFSHLEELSHIEILQRMPSDSRKGKPVRRSRKSDVIAYLRTWALGIEAYREDQAVASLRAAQINR